MKSIRIHLLWAVVTVVLSAGLAQVFASKKAASLHDKERKLQRELDTMKKTVFRLEKDLEAARRKNPTFAVAEPIPEVPAEIAPVEARPQEREARSRENEAITPDEIRAMLRRNDRGSRWRAFQAIDRIKDRALKLELLKELFAVGDGRMKWRGLEMLRDIGGPEAAKLAAELLRSEDSSYVRARAASLLAQLAGPSAIGPLQEAFNNDTNVYLRTSVAASLRNLGQSGAHQQMVVTLGGMSSDPDGARREDAVELMGRLGTADVFPFLARALNDTNSDVRRDAVESLADTGLPEAIPLLEQALNDPNPRVTSEARAALEALRAAENR